MIELDLEKVRRCLIWELKVLAAVRGVCVEQGIDTAWCEEAERETAKVLKSVRRVITVKGEIMQVESKR